MNRTVVKAPGIVQLPNSVLNKQCEKVEIGSKEARTLADALFEAMKLPDRFGVAAPQVGVNKRMFCAILKEFGRPILFINPLITYKGGIQKGREGCLSYHEGNNWLSIKRANFVRLVAFDIAGDLFEVEVNGFEARGLQHEIDHLEGITIVDRATK